LRSPSFARQSASCCGSRADVARPVSTANWRLAIRAIRTGRAGISFGIGADPLGRARRCPPAKLMPQTRWRARRRFSAYADSPVNAICSLLLCCTPSGAEPAVESASLCGCACAQIRELYFKPEETRTLLAAMAQHGDNRHKRYEKIRSQEIERGYHQPAHEWDMSLPCLESPHNFAGRSSQYFHKRFPAGSEYQSALMRCSTRQRTRRYIAGRFPTVR